MSKKSCKKCKHLSEGEEIDPKTKRVSPTYYCDRFEQWIDNLKPCQKFEALPTEREVLEAMRPEHRRLFIIAKRKKKRKVV